MSFFVKPTAARKPKSPLSGMIASVLAGLLTILVVAQLFKFEEFMEIIEVLHPSVGAASLIVASLMATLHVLALPFLLRMDVSPAFRWMSMVSGWVAAGVWIVLFGVLAWPLGLSIAALSAWSSWGLWPRRAKK